MSKQNALKQEFEKVVDTYTMVQVISSWGPRASRASWFVRLPSGREYCLPSEPKLVGTPEIEGYVEQPNGRYTEYWRPMCIGRVRGDLVVGSPGAIMAYALGTARAYYYRRRDYEDSHHD